jgi:hypothetical protein
MSKVSMPSPVAMPRPRMAGVTEIPWTEAERNQVLSHLEDILVSPAFRNSKRYCTLLRYVVERSLDGQADQLKERTIGVEAFGRQADYDTNIDHSVRSAAGEVRRRLAQYYIESGSNSTLRIEILSGSYVPQIRFLGHVAPSEEHDEEPAAQPAAAIERPQLQTVQESWSDSRRTRWLSTKRVAILSTAVLLIAVVALRLLLQAPSAYDAFWKPILSSPNAALLCFGGGAAAASDEAPATLSDFERSPIRRMNMSDALSLVAVTGALRSQGKQYRILNRAHATSFQELRQGPFILLGAMNNEWSLRLTSNLRFTFARDDSGAYIADKKNPSSRAWSFSYSTPVAQTTRDYAIVTRLRDPLTQQSGLIVAGIGAWGTQAAGEFVANPEEIRKIEAFVPARWEGKNLQVVIATDIIRGSSGPPVVLAAHVW